MCQILSPLTSSTGKLQHLKFLPTSSYETPLQFSLYFCSSFRYPTKKSENFRKTKASKIQFKIRIAVKNIFVILSIKLRKCDIRKCERTKFVNLPKLIHILIAVAVNKPLSGENYSINLQTAWPTKKYYSAPQQLRTKKLKANFYWVQLNKTFLSKTGLYSFLFKFFHHLSNLLLKIPFIISKSPYRTIFFSQIYRLLSIFNRLSSVNAED